MGKGNDAIARRKFKRANRKSKHSESLKVSNRIASIIAAKKRRKSGKRSMCQGMCYSLPTIEDPFNDRQGILDLKRKKVKKHAPSKTDRKMSTNRNTIEPKNGILDATHANLGCHEQKLARFENLQNKHTASLTPVGNEGLENASKLGEAMVQLIGKNAQEKHSFEIQGCPSKYLISCLNSIENALRHDGALITDDDKPLFVNTWGVEFWKCYSIGKDVVDTSGACSTTEQIAWIVSTAADTIARKEKEGLSLTNPFLLFLVPSQEKATKVRSVCKPLKALGIHTVSLHPGASLDRQIYGLRSCEPEFLVSTPERLLELVSVKAVDISRVSLLVIDGQDTLCKDDYLSTIKSTREHISGNPHTLVFNDLLNCRSTPILQSLLPRPVVRLSLNNSVSSQSAYIMQSIHVCASEEDKKAKGLRVLDHLWCNQLGPRPFKVLFIVGKDSDRQEFVTAIKSKGYFMLTDSVSCNSEVSDSEIQSAVSVINVDHVTGADLCEFEVVMILKFVLSTDSYIQILSKMARFTVKGVLHSFLTKEDAVVAAPLIKILEQCRMAVPKALRDLCQCHSTFTY